MDSLHSEKVWLILHRLPSSSGAGFLLIFPHIELAQCLLVHLRVFLAQQSKTKVKSKFMAMG